MCSYEINGEREVEYINRDGGVEKAWAENIDGGSIKLESRMHRVSMSNTEMALKIPLHLEKQFLVIKYSL